MWIVNNYGQTKGLTQNAFLLQQSLQPPPWVTGNRINSASHTLGIETLPYLIAHF